MADEVTADIPAPTGSADDINAIKSPQRVKDKAASQAFSENYQVTLSGQAFQKQHRTILATIGSAASPNDVSATPLPTAAGAYSQTDFQTAINELAALRIVVAQLVTLSGLQKQTIIDNLKSPTDQ